MNIRKLIVSVSLLGFLVLFVIGLSRAGAQSAQSKQCGTGVDHGTNRQCEDCSAPNHCHLAYFVQAQRYRVCEGAGTGCSNGTEAWCTGIVMTGTPTNPCGGTAVQTGGEDTVCYSVTFKTCVP